MTRIKELFVKEIDRKINGVIKINWPLCQEQ